MTTKEGTEMTCPRCNHVWDYTGSSWWITCPKCRKIMKNVKMFDEVKE